MRARLLVIAPLAAGLLALRPAGLSAQFVTRQSVATGGTQSSGGSARAPSVSADGGVIAFDSAATNLVAGDTNNSRDVFVRDVAARQTVRVSVASAGTQANAQSLLPVISGDGSSVAFLSDASNLVTGDTNGGRDVFVYDRRTGATTRVSVQPNGTQFDRAYAIDDDRAALSISRDGRYVAFAATRSFVTCRVGLLDIRQEATEVHLHDRQTGLTETLGSTAGISAYPSLSSEGRYAAFQGATATGTYIYVRDRQSGTLETIAVSTGTTERPSSVRYARISGDGRYVAFENDEDRTVVVHDRTSGQRTTFSGWAPAISGDGRFIAHSGARLYDLLTGRGANLALTSSGLPGNGNSFTTAPSADGRAVAFVSSAANLVPDDTNAQDDVFVAHVGVSADVAIEVSTAAGGHPSLLTYNLTLRNRGPDTALNLVIPDVLTDKTSFYSCAAPAGVTCLGQTHSTNEPQIEIPLLRVNESVTIAVTVFKFFDAPATITNSISVASFVSDPDPANNQTTVTTSASGSSCSFAITPTAATFGSGGGTGSVAVTATAGCAWSVSSNASWIALTGNTSGSGNGTVSYTVAPNATGAARTGTMPIAAQTFTVTQAAGAATSFTRYFAEGATSSFFSTYIALANPGDSNASVTLRFLKTEGQIATTSFPVPAMSRRTVGVGQIAGMEQAEFSTTIESDRPIVADRSMSWDATGYGSHAETAISEPSITWYLAEGATHSGFNLFYLIQNPGTAAATVQVTYLLPAPTAPVVKTYSVPPSSRFTIWVNQEGAALASTDVSAIINVTNGVPVIVERAMYLDAGGRTFGAGHESAGVAATATSWFLAEGATGPYFDLFVLMANPNATDAAVTATYLLPNGTTVTKTYVVKARSRFTIFVDAEHPSLADTAVSTTIASTNGVGIVVERSMWWPGPTAASWHEAHNSPGATATGTKWAFAEGNLGGPLGFETFILVANTSPTSATVRVTLLFENTTASKDFSIAANSRFNVAVASEFPTATNRLFGAVVESLGSTPAQIVVERAIYSNAGGAAWAAGTNALATRLQ